MVQTLQIHTDSRMQKYAESMSWTIRAGLQKSQSLFVPFQSRCHMAVLFLSGRQGCNEQVFYPTNPFLSFLHDKWLLIATD